MLDFAVAASMPDMRHADQVGGLLMFGFEGTTADDLPADLVAQSAGVILFRRNIKSAQQLRALTEAIACVPRPDGSAPLIAIDQEGGTVSRLAGIGTTTPSAMALGAAADGALTESIFRLVGDELFALGINVDFAPVADISDNPDNPAVGTRAFGDDAAAVARHVRAVIRGLRAAGVAATAKHFPGHGDTPVDSHLDLPSITHSGTRMAMGGLVPFVAAIAERVDLIMSAHVVYTALEKDLPATLSRAILSGLLREELGFGGVISTDCLEMSAIAARFTPGEAAVKAVAAGADLVLFSHTESSVRSAQAALVAAVRDGTISPARVAESLARIAALRTRLLTAPDGQKERARDLASVGSDAHQAVALGAARRAIAFVRDPNGLLPLSLGSGDKILVVQFAGDGASAVEDAAPEVAGDGQAATGRVRFVTAIGRALAQGPARVHEQVRSLDPAGHEYKQLLMAAGTANAVVAVTSRAKQHPMQARAVADLALIGKRVIVIAAREPYDADVLPPEMTVIASFGEDAHAMRAAAEVVLGTAAARGTLPVQLASAVGEPR